MRRRQRVTRILAGLAGASLVAATLALSAPSVADPGSTGDGAQGRGSDGRTDADLTARDFTVQAAPGDGAPGTGVPFTPLDPDYDLLAPGTTDEAGVLSFVRNIPKSAAFANTINSNMVFDGDILFQGSYDGLQIFDLSEDPMTPELIAGVVCPGGQGDLTLAGDLAFFSVDAPRSSSACDSTAVPSSTPGNWEGIRVFDVSDPADPQYVADYETRCGSHTQTVVPDPNDPNVVFLYNGSYDVSETADTCKPPHEIVEIIEVPLDDPGAATMVEHQFWDEENRPFQVTDRKDGGANTSVTRGCHDLTSYAAYDLLAGACMGDGLLVDVSDPGSPVVLDRMRDENFAFWHTAQFNNDASTVIFNDELGGGVGATCVPGIPQYRGANALYDIDADAQLTLASYFKIPRRQSTTENCVTHEGNVIPVEGRDILVQGFYRGGVSVFDFTDTSAPVEIGYFDRGPYPAGTGGSLGGAWASYIHNGVIYSSEIFEGLDVLTLQGDEFADAFRHRQDLRNPAAQVPITWDWKDTPVLPGRIGALPQAMVTPGSVPARSGQPITVSAPAGTFEADEYVDVWTRGVRGRVLATEQAAADGSVSLTFSLPVWMKAGQKTLLVRGDAELDDALWRARVRVTPAGG